MKGSKLESNADAELDFQLLFVEKKIELEENSAFIARGTRTRWILIQGLDH